MFGGTLGAAEQAERDKHTIGLFSNTSTAMMEKQSAQRKEAMNSNLENAKKAVDAINAIHRGH